MKRYKICLMIGIALVLMILPGEVVFAGDINSAEADLLEYLSGTFTYDGHKYKATSSALATARAKLSEDGIDLTEAQCKKAKQFIQSNLKTGIESGYLVEIKNEKEKKEEASKDSESGAGETDKESSNTPETKASKKETVSSDYIKVEYSDFELDTDEVSITVEKYLEGKVSVRKGKTSVLEGSLPVKNTGISIEKGLLMAKILGSLFFMLIIMSLVELFFAKKNKHQ
ncbi:MAG: hypothetical protein Q4F05_13615 [bacterium]|nr:hypothetical protein [bacterium]